MFFDKKLIQELADILEGLVISDPSGQPSSIVIFHPRDKAAVTKESAQSAVPLIEINLLEAGDRAIGVIHSALGVIELRDIDEVRLSRSTEEAAFFLRAGADAVTVVTVSSRGILQVYVNIPRSITTKELSEIAEEDLRAAVALKVFGESTSVYSNSVRV